MPSNDAVRFYPVDCRVGSPKYDGPELIDSVATKAAPPCTQITASCAP